MPLLILILLIVLVANIGFWDTLQAIFGALAIIGLFWLTLAALAAAVGYWLYAKMRERL